MPLSASTSRQHMHTRAIICHGYVRDDGLWDIEAHLRDTKAYAFENVSRGIIESGDPLHDMWIRLTVDAHMNIREIEAVTDKGPDSICGNITPDFEKLVGIQIGPGWMRKVRNHVGGAKGCTHLVELLQTIATVAFQTIFSRKKDQNSGAAKTESSQFSIINSCHALRSDSPVVKQEWSEFYTGC